MRPVLLCALLLACSEDPQRGWHVAGGFLRDSGGRAVILRGVNLSNAHKVKPYFGFHQAEDFKRIRADWGMNAVRFLVEWAAIEPQKGQFDDAYLDQVAQRMDWARAAGLLVVVDMHQDLYGEGFAAKGGNGAPPWTCDEAHYTAHQPVDPWFLNYLGEHVQACVDGFWTGAELQDHYAEAWRRVARRLAGYEMIVGFDVINEPHWGSDTVERFETEKLSPFYERMVAAVRSVRPGWVAFLEPAASRNIGLSTHLVPFPFADVAYAPHSYAAGAEAGGGFEPAQREFLMTNVATLAAEAQALGAALWIGEYGGVAAHPGIVPYMDAQYDAAGAVAAGAMYWEYGRNELYGLLDSAGAEKPELVDTLVRPAPERIAGDPVSYAWDEAISTFTLTFRPRELDAPTEISVPARRFPGGYRVECGGCEVEKLTGKLRVLEPPEGEVVTVTIAPARP